MSPENWNKIKEIFLEAVELDGPAARAGFLAQKCGGDEELRREVENLIRQDEEAESLMKRPAMENTAVRVLAESLAAEAAGGGGGGGDELIGETVGAYRIIGELGRGGMGAVYLGERSDGTFRRKVAVKLIKRGMETEFTLRRFRNERQVLAALSHPNIAQLYDGGTTPAGTPYFVMEYVEGEPLYRYCDRRKLGVRERLEIFLPVCEAVHAAHQIKVVHRDLKPSNILVARDGVPKLLDFGIAKLLDAELSDGGVEQTATQMRLMTPEYASPEQVSGERITPASDIYSLGVMLYELLSGHRPYRFKNRAPHEIARVVCEQSPEGLRRSLDSRETLLEKGEAATLEKVLESRGSNLRELRRELSGDLERIVMNALHKKPEDRYASALAFAEDIRSYLENKPLKSASRSAGRQQIPAPGDEPTLAVLPLKIIGAAAAAAGVGADEQYLSIGLADSLITRLSRLGRLIVCPTSSILRYGEGEDPFEAGRELGVDFVVDGNIRFAGGRIRVTAQLLNVREHATHWSESFDEQFTDVLEVEDSISERVTEALIPHLTAAERKELSRRETNDVRAYEAYLKGRFHWNQFTPESLPKALKSFQTAVALDPAYALAFVGMADYHIWANIYGLTPPKRSLAEAERYARRAAELDKTLGEAHATLSFVMQSRRQWAEAERLKREAIRLAPGYHHAHEWYADQLIATGRTEEGLREATIAERLAPSSLRTKTMVAFAFYQAHEFEEALERGRQIMDLDKNYPQGYSQIGISLWGLGRYEEALPYLAKFNDLIPDSAYAKYQYCFALAKAGRREEARRVLDQIKTLADNAYVKPYFLAMAHAALGETGAAFHFFEQSFAEDDPWLLWFGTEPMLEDLRGDARYRELLARLKNPLAEKYSSAASAEKSVPREQKSVAVLPLEFMGEPEETDAFLSIGLADAMITRLSGVRRLVVRPTSSVLRFAEGGARDAFAAGDELKVDFVLSGSIRRGGERIRISAQLSDVRSRATVWADRFDENFTDVLELEDAVAEKVAGLLIPRLTGEERERLQKRGTNSPAAYEAFMRGRYLANQFTSEAILKSIDAFEEAIRLDPNYALPRVGIAEFYVWSSVFGAIHPGEAYPKAKGELRRALAIDDRLAEAYSLASFVALLHDWDWAEAERLSKRALAINPNYYFAHNALAHVFASAGEAAEAMREIKISESLDPLSPLAKVMTSCISYQARHFDEAARKARQGSEMQLDFPQAFLHLGNTLPYCGGTREAIEVLTRLAELWQDSALPKSWLCFALVAGGEVEKAREVLASVLKMAETQFVKPYFVAMAHTALGEFDLAFEWFSKAVEIRDEWMIWFGTDIKLDALHSDPRYFEVLGRTNNPIIGRRKRKSGS